MKMGCFLVIVLVVLGLGVAKCHHSGEDSSPQLITQIRNSMSAWVGEENWPPERIAADPSGFAKYALKRSRSLTEELEGHLGTIRKQIQELSALSNGHAQTLQALEKELASLCTAYSRARASNTWPANVSGSHYDESSLKEMIEQVKWRIDQTEQLKVRARKECEEKAAQAKSLELKLSDAKLNQINLTGKTVGIGVQETLQNLEHLEDNIRAVAETGTEHLIRNAMNDGAKKLTDEQLNDLLATHSSTSVPDAAASIQEESAFGIAPNMNSDNKTVQDIFSDPENESSLDKIPTVIPQRRTLTPEQKAALGTVSSNNESMTHRQNTQETPSRSDIRVPLLPPPPAFNSQKRK